LENEFSLEPQERFHLCSKKPISLCFGFWVLHIIFKIMCRTRIQTKRSTSVVSLVTRSLQKV